MVFTQSPAAADVFHAPARAADASTAETVVVDGGRVLRVERDITGARYRLDGKLAYHTDAGTLLTGILVWGRDATEVYLPVGGRRRDRGWVRAPRFLRRELMAGGPVRVFHQRLGDLWAIERPGRALVVRRGSGEALEFAPMVDGAPGALEVERPWSALSEEQHVARVALWAQILAMLAPSSRERALAEDVRVAAFDAADHPRCTLAMVSAHVALRGRDLSLGGWRARLSRATAGAASRR